MPADAPLSSEVPWYSIEQWFEPLLFASACVMVVILLAACIFAVIGYRGIKDHRLKWDEIEKELNGRYKSIGKLKSEHHLPPASTATKEPLGLVGEAQPSPPTTTANHPVNARMMLIDIIVEKAQRKLSDRSASYFASGVLLFLFSGILVLMFAAFLFFNAEISFRISHSLLAAGKSFQECTTYVKNNPAQFAHVLDSKEDSAAFPDMVCMRLHKNEMKTFPDDDTLSRSFAFTLEIFKRLAAGGAVLGTAYIIGATANSCFRESTILLHRRHLLRYIRLMSYEKDGEIDRKDLRDIFGVDQAVVTGFDNVKTESIKDNLLGKLIEAVGRMGAGSKRCSKSEDD